MGKMQCASLILGSIFVCAIGTASGDDAGTPVELPRGKVIIDVIGGWPKFLTLNDGTVLSLNGNSRRASSDGGLTWAKPEPVFDEDQRTGGVCSAIRLQSGEIGVVTSRVGGIPNVGHDAENFREGWLHFHTSADEGQTWSEGFLINKFNNDGKPYEDNLIQTRSGRLVLPVRVGFRVNSAVHQTMGAYGLFLGERIKFAGHTTYPEMDVAFCFLSDDNGRNWYKSDGDVFGWLDGGRGGIYPCDEPAAIELKDGRLMMLCRSTCGHILRSYSEDEGYRWSVPEPMGLASAYAPSMIRRIPSTGDLVLVWNQASPDEISRGFQRNRLSLAISQDEGQTWTHAKTLFHNNVPAVGLLEPPPPVWQRPQEWLGEMPESYATADYPNIHFHEDNILISYDHNPWHPPAGIWTLRILPVAELYE